MFLMRRGSNWNSAVCWSKRQCVIRFLNVYFANLRQKAVTFLTSRICDTLITFKRKKDYVFKLPWYPYWLNKHYCSY
jgi:hypothetical protein